MVNIESKLELLIESTATIRDALKRLDLTGEGILFVVSDARKLKGVITDGDIRRSLLNGHQIGDNLENTFNPNPFFFFERDYDKATAIKIITDKRLAVVPILNDLKEVIYFTTWDELLSGHERKIKYRQIDVPVVIMAGGKGTRMVPFTNVLPKPLIPIGEKTILEVIIDEFSKFGIKDYYFTVNYRAEMIKAYFDCIEKDYRVHYLREKDFYGTAGSLNLLPPGLPSTFIVSNCDIIVKADFANVVDFHQNSGAMLTVLSSIQHHTVPYGVIKYSTGGIVSAIEEKPEYSYCVNTGVYILDKACLDYIPEGEMFHMTHLMDALMADGKKVVTYPVNEREYIDIGQWDEYRSAIKMMQDN